MQATVELITRWVLGTGPCGQACAPSDKGKFTGEDVFDNFTADVKTPSSGSKSEIIALFDEVRSNSSQVVFDVNANEGWEHERMIFTIQLEPHITTQDIR